MLVVIDIKMNGFKNILGVFLGFCLRVWYGLVILEISLVGW